MTASVSNKGQKGIPALVVDLFPPLDPMNPTSKGCFRIMSGPDKNKFAMFSRKEVQLFGCSLNRADLMYVMKKHDKYFIDYIWTFDDTIRDGEFKVIRAWNFKHWCEESSKLHFPLFNADRRKPGGCSQELNDFLKSHNISKNMLKKSLVGKMPICPFFPFIKGDNGGRIQHFYESNKKNCVGRFGILKLKKKGRLVLFDRNYTFIHGISLKNAILHEILTVHTALFCQIRMFSIQERKFYCKLLEADLKTFPKYFATICGIGVGGISLFTDIISSELLEWLHGNEITKENFCKLIKFDLKFPEEEVTDEEGNVSLKYETVRCNEVDSVPYEKEEFPPYFIPEAYSLITASQDEKKALRETEKNEYDIILLEINKKQIEAQRKIIEKRRNKILDEIKHLIDYENKFIAAHSVGFEHNLNKSIELQDWNSHTNGQNQSSLSNKAEKLLNLELDDSILKSLNITRNLSGYGLKDIPTSLWSMSRTSSSFELNNLSLGLRDSSQYSYIQDRNSHDFIKVPSPPRDIAWGLCNLDSGEKNFTDINSTSSSFKYPSKDSSNFCDSISNTRNLQENRLRNNLSDLLLSSRDLPRSLLNQDVKSLSSRPKLSSRTSNFSTSNGTSGLRNPSLDKFDNNFSIDSLQNAFNHNVNYVGGSKFRTSFLDPEPVINSDFSNPLLNQNQYKKQKIMNNDQANCSSTLWNNFKPSVFKDRLSRKRKRKRRGGRQQ